MRAPYILITGASSGLGLAFIDHYMQKSTEWGHFVIAIDNKPFPVAPQDYPRECGNLIVFHQADITSLEEIQAWVQKHYSTPIELIIHCAGVRGLVPAVVAREKQSSKVVAEAETLENMDHTTMMRTFEINTCGTLNVVKAFLPLLRCFAAGVYEDAKVTRKPKVLILSSRMGSISANTAGGGYAYRASKAALNAVVKSLAIDIPDVQFLMLHPGRVETGLVEWKEEGAISVQESVRNCMRVLDKTDKEGWESGRLVDRFGEVIPW